MRTWASWPAAVAELALVLGADEGYAQGMAVALHSALTLLSASTDVEVYILDSGLSESSRFRLARVAQAARSGTEPAWIAISPEGLRAVGGQWLAEDSVFHARVLIPSLLPARIERAVYLDADVLVRRDLAELFTTDLRQAPVAAVRDYVITSTDHEMSGVRERSSPRPYFNSGVLVIDLVRWRSLNVTERALEYAAAGNAALPFPEQDALNAVVDRWYELDLRWNVNNLLFDPVLSPAQDEFTRDLYRQRWGLYHDAAILHFVRKPWNRYSRAPGSSAWARALLRSGWHPPGEAAAWLLRYAGNGLRYGLGTKKARMRARFLRRGSARASAAAATNVARPMTSVEDKRVGGLRPNKLATTLWFLRRPYTYPHLAEMVRRGLSPAGRRREDTSAEALAWGSDLAITPPEALQVLLGPGDYRSPRELHPEAFAAAQTKVEESEVLLGGAANLELLYHLVRGLGARRVVETGVAYGWSSLAILLAQEALGGGSLVSTDMPYPRLDGEEEVGVVVPELLRGSWRLIRRPDRSGLPRALAQIGEIDLAHYDSDKTYAGQSWAFGRLWTGLRPGGVLIVDDINYQTAFRDFSAAVGIEPIVVDGQGKLIGVLRKPTAR